MATRSQGSDASVSFVAELRPLVCASPRSLPDIVHIGTRSASTSRLYRAGRETGRRSLSVVREGRADIRVDRPSPTRNVREVLPPACLGGSAGITGEAYV